jgi:hypothetical protein
VTTNLQIPPERDLPPGRLARRKEHLMEELARTTIEARSTGRARWEGRRRWAAVAGVAAAALVIAVAAPTLLGSRRGGAQDAAAAVLLRVAKVAATRHAVVPPEPGQYVYTKTEAVWESDWADVGPNHDQYFSVLMPVVREAWIGPDGSGRLREETGEPTFLTDHDRSVWIAAGRPALGGNETRDESHGAGGLSYLDLSTLPTDPAALRRMIEERTVEGGPPGNAETFTIVGDLLRETYAPPELRAALFEIASELPGVELIGTVEDPMGREGIAVAYPSDGILHELIFDPTTSALLAERTVVADPGEANLQVPAGTVVGWAAYLASGIVDSTQQGS